MVVSWRRWLTLVLAPLVAITALVGVSPVLTQAAPPPPNQDWPTFLHDVQRTSASGEQILTQANATTLKLRWSYLTGGVVAASPTLAGGVAYVGSWDGKMYAINAQAGTLKWKTNLGTTFSAPCFPPNIGITSAAAVVNGVVYVGGGDAYWYALDATTGAVLWKVFTGDNTQAGAHYNWSSPLISAGFAYIGVASNCDNPLVQGQLLKVDLATHAVVGQANMVPDGQVGGGIWTSPALDPVTNTVFVTTGTLNLFTQTMSEALVAIDAGTMAIKDHWQLPRIDAGSDSDWGTSPILFTDAGNRKLVAATSKNGYLYAWDRNNLAAGPAWRTQIAVPGDCPTCGDGGISSGAFANGVLYFAGGNTTINGVGWRGAVRALNPATGAVIWAHGTDAPVIPGVAWDNGLVIEAAGPVAEVLNAANGNALYTYRTGADIYGAPSVWNGKIYLGSSDSNVYSFALPTTVTPPPADPNCPAGFLCQDIRNPAPGSEVVNGDGSWTITAAGAAIHGNSDQFRFVSKNLPGDVQLGANLTQQSTQGLQPQAGIMLRQNSDPQSPFYAILEYPNNNTENQPLPKYLVWYRTTFGDQSVQATKVYPAALPRSFMIQRKGNSFSGMVSTDGVNYKLLPGTTQSFVMPNTLMGGVAVDSGISNTTGTATFSNVTTGPITVTPTPATTPSPCPVGWSCNGVANPSPVGDQALAGGVWTVKGSGQQIGKFYDTFHFVNQPIPGDATLTGQVTSQANTAAGAKAGLMFRQNLDPGSPYYAVLVTPGQGITVQWRTTNNLPNRPKVSIPGSAPQFFRISRYTDTQVNPAITYYTTYTSADGVNWNVVSGSTVPLQMPGTILGGMAVNSALGGTLGQATFGGVSLTAGATRPNTLCLAGWTCDDVGTGFPTGGQVFNGGSWLVSAAGNDIWDGYDRFHFIHQGLASDGTVSARVVSQANVGEWAKAGVMLRSTTDPVSAYYGAFVTPSHGVDIQYRATDGAVVTQQPVLVPGTAPVWLRVSRWTDSVSGISYYTSYSSADGTAWTMVPNSTVVLNLPPELIAGVAADSWTPDTGQTVFEAASVTTTATPPPDACPTTWTCQDIGAGFPAGSQTMSGGSWTLNAGGPDIWDTTDELRLVSQPLPADGTVIARVTGQAGAGEWAKAGVMMRATSDTSSPYYGAFVTPSHGVVVQWRPTPGAATSQLQLVGTLPAWLMIGRYTSGPTTYYTAYTSPDGTNWTAVPGSRQVLTLPGTLLAGLAADSWNGALAQVTLDGVAVGGPAPAPPGLCPTTWTCADIGGAVPTGTQDLAAGSWTVQGGGGDIWNGGDQFRYAYQSLPADGTLSARVVSQGNTNAWAKAGLMMRGGTDTQAPYYGILVTPGNGVVVQYRDTQGGPGAEVQLAGGAPAYLRITRTGTSFTAFTSADGLTWTAVAGSTVDLPNLSGTLLEGLAVTSHDTGQLSTVVFDSVGLT